MCFSKKMVHSNFQMFAVSDFFLNIIKRWCGQKHHLPQFVKCSSSAIYIFIKSHFRCHVGDSDISCPVIIYESLAIISKKFCAIAKLRFFFIFFLSYLSASRRPFRCFSSLISSSISKTSTSVSSSFSDDDDFIFFVSLPSMLSSSLRLLWDALFSRSGFESRPFRKKILSF